MLELHPVRITYSLSLPALINSQAVDQYFEMDVKLRILKLSEGDWNVLDGLQAVLEVKTCII